MQLDFFYYHFLYQNFSRSVCEETLEMLQEQPERVQFNSYVVRFACCIFFIEMRHELFSGVTIKPTQIEEERQGSENIFICFLIRHNSFSGFDRISNAILGWSSLFRIGFMKSMFAKVAKVLFSLCMCVLRFWVRQRAEQQPERMREDLHYDLFRLNKCTSPFMVIWLCRTQKKMESKSQKTK